MATAALIFSSGSVLAQNDGLPKPSPVDPKRNIPEKIAPPEEGISTPAQKAPTSSAAPPETLSEKLSRTEGVLRPPRHMDPDVLVPAPVPNPGTTRVIPPPGTPGNPSPERPK